MTLEQQLLIVVADIRNAEKEFAQMTADVIAAAISRPGDRTALKAKLEQVTDRLQNLDAQLKDLQQRLAVKTI